MVTNLRVGLKIARLLMNKMNRGLYPALFAERQVILCDLIILRHVGIEVVLAVELGIAGNFAVEEEAGEDHPFANEEHHCGGNDRHDRKEEEKSLPVPGEIRGCPQRRGEEGREDHRKTDRKSPEPAASPRDRVGEIPGVDNGNDDDGESRVGEIEEGPCENLPAGRRCFMTGRRGCRKDRG